MDRIVPIRQELIKQGYEARIVIGLTPDGQGHAWVEHKNNDGEWVLYYNF